MALIKSKPPYWCKICGLTEVKEAFGICEICGWEADSVQDANHDYEGGANHLSLNQYKSTWLANKQKITECSNCKNDLVEELFVANGGIAKYVNRTTVQKKKSPQ